VESLPAQSVVLLQSGAHNPTGCDPSPSQWRELASIFLRRGHLAFVDAAYPGFASGDIDADLEGVRLFAELEVPLILVSTYGKCFGLYSERVGVLSILVPDEDVGKRIETQLRLLARAESGAPPDFGSRIVETVLSDQKLEHQWRQEVRGMADGLKSRRHALRKALEELKTPGDWQPSLTRTGCFRKRFVVTADPKWIILLTIFRYLGLSEQQVNILQTKYHVYVQDSGRISIASV